MVIVALTVALVAIAVAQQIDGSGEASRLAARRALSATIGFASLAVAADCTLARSHMEGLGGCLGDIAGGYCVYQSCDVMAQPDLGAFPTSHLHIESVPSDHEPDEAP
jgi:hypothetical protein